MKLQGCWLILEHYGYNEHLRISDEYLVGNEMKKKANDEKWENVECSERTTDFLERLFHRFKNRTNHLDSENLGEIFQTTVEGVPWDIEYET
jgi:hypothetical protein